MATLAFTSLVTSGCVTKKFVRMEVGKTEHQVEQLTQRVDRLETELTGEEAALRALAAEGMETRTAVEEVSQRLDETVKAAAFAMKKAEEASDVATRASEQPKTANGHAQRKPNGRTQREPVETVTVLFGFDRWHLDVQARATLANTIRRLRKDPKLVAQLEGHADNRGSHSYNLWLSRRRADAVRRFLLDGGIELNRVQVTGAAGETQPIADNQARMGRDQNRRVTVKLFGRAV